MAPYGEEILIKIDSGNVSLFESSKPLPEPMLTYAQ